VGIVHLRRTAIGALAVSLVAAGSSSWWILESASLASYVITAAVLFVPIFALRVIIDVGGVLLADERRMSRRAGIDDQDPWA
jgi:hypothetical protein